ncbi:2,3-diphosphoglycerate-dependent phosphoglycerate mutase [Atopobacter phocae]|uniref:2,3-diphosphoglycerate-dependent phosphoglycerate mutase n=1 Tax=Atopobacter phocae TaxID=136492 RepID=UPI00047119C5|nr:2,3-diphosphoglycerate-dependent phosphoglycerate mutase [Atopobacter phocae]
MKLVLIRHGQSEWNQANLFTGWEDVDLSEQGLAEARAAGDKLKKAGIEVDIAYTSVLKRAIKTLFYVLESSDQLFVPVTKSWRLNERHYGALQGLNKAETAAKYGDEQVHIWRRSYNVSPPEMTAEMAQKFKMDRRYRFLNPDNVPTTENLEITLNRVMPYFNDQIVPAIMKGQNVLVAAHGNSLRAMCKYLEQISDDEITSLEIPTGEPIVYELDEHLNVLSKTILK